MGSEIPSSERQAERFALGLAQNAKTGGDPWNVAAPADQLVAFDQFVNGKGRRLFAVYQLVIHICVKLRLKLPSKIVGLHL
jgi:hypothetical protein